MPGEAVLAQSMAESRSSAAFDSVLLDSADEVNRAFNQLAQYEERHSPLKLGDSSGQHPPLSIGIRNYLGERDGSGYWEFVKPAEHLLISITDARYRRAQWIEIPPTRLLKLRLLLAGKLVGAKREAILTGPQAHLHMSSGESPEGYYIAGEEHETKLIVLHCATEFIEQTLRLHHGELPPPIDAMVGKRSGGATRRISISSEVFHAAQRILESRHYLPNSLRCAYLGSMATTLFCEVFAELSNRDHTRHAAAHLHTRDINCIYEARDYLAQHFVAPPTIPQLARMVGINQTKLKIGFKSVAGMTIHDYVLERRMELASELLLSQTHNITEIAYRVGYEYPTNFTYAFKRHFGRPPRAWRRQR